MAHMFTAKEVTVEYPTKRVLDQVTFGIDEGDRIGIVGQNGVGKSSLLSLIAGSVQPQSGALVKNGTPTIGMLGQADRFQDDDIVSDYLNSADGIPYSAQSRSRHIVETLLGNIDLTARVGTLSGGQRRRLDLASLLLGSWDILLLDEPTNHLDISAINWLADHLKHRWQTQSGALLVVTHDRWFLDEVCTSMWELHQGRLLPFEGGYSAYVMQRVERARLDEVARQKRNNQLRKELAWLSRGAQARRSKPKFHLEQAAALIADVPPPRDSIELKNVAMARLGKQVIEMDDVSLSYGDLHIIEGVSWIIGAGDRIGILGENGTGKTTFLRFLAGELPPSSGKVKVGKTVRLAFLSQTLEELAAVEDDVVRVVCSRYKTHYLVDGKLLSPTALLERLGFSSADLNARCKDLSGGQRRRLQFMLTLLEEPNVLILDEPGNDLDTDMLAALEDLLDSWPGTLIVVSHDRYLIERTTDNQYAIIDKNIVHLPGGVDEYLALVKDAPTKQTTREASSKAKPQAEAHALRKKLASLERKMETQKKRVADAQRQLDEADPYNFEELSERQAALDAQRAQLAELEDEWLETSIALQ